MRVGFVVDRNLQVFLLLSLLSLYFSLLDSKCNLLK